MVIWQSAEFAVRGTRGFLLGLLVRSPIPCPEATVAGEDPPTPHPAIPSPEVFRLLVPCRLRVLITEINAATLKFEAEAMLADPERSHNLRVVMRLLAEERLRVRCAPLLDWAPNFSVFVDGQGRCDLLLGVHWFQIPYPSRGLALAVVYRGGQADGVRARFQEMWDLAHDIGPALRGVFEAAERAT